VDADQDNAWARRFGDRCATRSRDYDPPTVRGVARRCALDLLSSIDRLRGRVHERVRQPRTQILLLHHLFDDEVASFRRLLLALSRDHELIGYDEAVRRIGSRTHPRPAIAVSFDDGRRSCKIAADVLEEFQTTGAFFVCPEIIGERDARRVRDFCLDRLHYPAVDFLDWDELGALHDRGHVVGNHTYGHRNLGRIAADEAIDQIGRANDALSSRLGGCEHFAWPYGGFANVTAEAIAEVVRTEHASCASAVRGCHLALPEFKGNSRADSEPEQQQRSALPCLLRDNILARWPVRHVRWFLARNVETARTAPTEWPVDWRPTIERACASSS